MKLIAAVLFYIFTVAATAEDLGVRAQTYAPDRDGREQMKDSLRAKQKSGELDRFWQQYRSKSIEAIKHPAPLGIKTDYSEHSELRELRFVIPQDYRDERGRIVVAKGTVVEPLKIRPLHTGLIFIDGRDQRQIDYAIARGRQQPLKITLTAGSPYELREKYKGQPWNGSPNIPFYFDQRKIIINSFKQLYGIDLNSVPVTVSQKGAKMLIEYGMPKS